MSCIICCKRPMISSSHSSENAAAQTMAANKDVIKAIASLNEMIQIRSFFVFLTYALLSIPKEGSSAIIFLRSTSQYSEGINFDWLYNCQKFCILASKNVCMEESETDMRNGELHMFNLHMPFQLDFLSKINKHYTI